MFVRGLNPIWFFNDLTGRPLDDTYWIFFLTNDLPYTFQPVYQDPNGLAVWNNPIQFQPNGGLPNNIYFIPDAVYRIEVRQGQSTNDPLIGNPIENYVPVATETENDPLITARNLITNPQFADVYFNGSYTYTQISSSTYILEIAPGWTLTLTGAGTTVVTQVENAGNNNIEGNPPYYITINNSGWTTAVLSQTFDNNGALFANGAASIAFLADATTSAQTISINLVPSIGASTTLFTGQISASTLQYYFGSSDISTSTNSDTGIDATTSLQISLPGTSILSFSNFQLVGQSIPLSSSFVPSQGTDPGSAPEFQEISYERVVDQEFHVFKDSILNQQKNSILTAWNFSNNPWQFRSPAISNVATNTYTADQTIVIQQAYVASATGNNIAVGQGSLSDNYGFTVQAVTANNQFAILQYIAPQSCRNCWGNIMSAMVKLNLNTVHNSTINFKARLIYRAGLPTTTAQAVPIATWAAGQDPVAAAGYTLIAPPFDPVYTISTDTTSFSFNGFQLPVSSDVNMTLGILIYTVSNMDENATADSIVINDISLVQNEFALPTQLETLDETLQKCEYYYEKSYDSGVQPATATDAGQLVFIQNYNSIAGPNTQFFPGAFTIEFKNSKNRTPTMTIYSTGGLGQPVASANVLAAVFSNAHASGTPGNLPITDWTQQISLSNASYSPTGAGSPWISCGGDTVPQDSQIYLHFVANSQLGV